MTILTTSLHKVSPAAKILCWLSPLSVLVYLIIAKTLSFCLLQAPSKNTSSRPRRYAVIGLLAIVTLSFMGQAVTYIVRALFHPGWWAPQSVVIYLVISIMLWAGLLINIVETAEPIWHPYVGSWYLALAFETALSIELSRADDVDKFSTATIVAQVIRVLAILALCAAGSWYILERKTDDGEAAEHQPLLVDQAAQDQTPGYGTEQSTSLTNTLADDDNGDSEDETRDDKEKKKQEEKRLQKLKEKGNWFAFLSDFGLLIPLVWPTRKEYKVQICLVVVGLLILLNRAWTVLAPRQLGIVVNELTSNAGTGQIPYQPLLLWFLFTWLNSEAGLSMISGLAETPAEQYARKKVGTTAFNHVMSLSMDFHNEKNSGELMAGISQGSRLYDMVGFLCFQMAPMMLDLAVAVVYVTYLFDSYMALIVLATFVAYTYVSAKVTKWGASKRRQNNTFYREESKVLNESLSNWLTVSHFNRGDYECGRYAKTLDNVNIATWNSSVVWTVGYGIQELVMLIGTFSAAFLAAYRVSQGSVPVGSFVTLLTYWESIQMPMHMFNRSIRRGQEMLIDAERLLELLRTKPTVADAPDAKPLVIKEGVIEFKDVAFSYDPRKPTIKDISFTAKAGSTIALVGETGGGKSTILKLVYRYYDITSGSITIDGQDIRSVTLDSLRNAFGMVPQDAALFNISIMDNIRYARLEATDEEVYTACRKAAIHDKILSFPDGYKATVGERGVKLSGGELQRVAIARAILRDPAIVMLDEATSMIDAETEAKIQEAFKSLTKDRTTFVVAHRLSTIQNADLILVVQDGEVIQRGTHEELFAQKGKYHDLWSKQMSKGEKQG
ncbi:hypothetical protein MBLNU457_6137t1 [Dothideomycetes sp. NU457]